MTDHPGFLADIIANRDDDAPRLIYADWLDDHGRPGLARLIRRQVANPDDVLDIAAGDGLYGGDGEEIYRCPSSWGRTPADHREKWLIRRGFIETVETTLADALDHLPALARRHPIREVRVSDRIPGALFTDPRVAVWWGLEPMEDQDDLPYEVYGRLKSGRLPWPGSSYRAYDSPEAARADLSQALLALARAANSATAAP